MFYDRPRLPLVCRVASRDDDTRDSYVSLRGRLVLHVDERGLSRGIVTRLRYRVTITPGNK